MGNLYTNILDIPQNRVDGIGLASFPQKKTPPFRWASPVWRWTCHMTQADFWLLLRKHHCRKCGRCICHSCSPPECMRPLPQLGHMEPCRHCKAGRDMWTVVGLNIRYPPVMKHGNWKSPAIFRLANHLQMGGFYWLTEGAGENACFNCGLCRVIVGAWVFLGVQPLIADGHCYIHGRIR